MAGAAMEMQARSTKASTDSDTANRMTPWRLRVGVT